MRKTGFVYDQRYLLHDTGPFHPEVPMRLEAIYAGIKSAGLISKLVRVDVQPAELKWIKEVHTAAYIRRFEEICRAGHHIIDTPDCRICSDSYDIALLAAGGVLQAARMLMEGEIDNAFCAIRPPGHHAVADQAMGFCFFNNIAIAVRYLQKQWCIKRVGIVDFDVHHGNGTQEVFESDPTVFYYSIHQHPSFAYPGTGLEFERGTGEGMGYTCNSPVLPGQGDAAYEELIETKLVPALAEFKPEVVLLSVGFDAHEDDDISDIKLTTKGYGRIAQKMVQLAQQYTDGRIISILEGGYSLARLPELATDHIRILLDA